MSSSGTEVTKQGPNGHSSFKKAGKNAIDANHASGNTSRINLNGTPNGKSRYGRTIKPKSPDNENSGSPKSSRMPKFRRNQNSSDSANESLDEDKISNGVEEAEDSSSNVSSVPEQIGSPKTNGSTLMCNWELGQLAWARVGNFPFWPCVVTLDPALMLYHRLKATGRSQVTMVHVQYFGDKGRHSWVSSNYMIPFTNLADFNKLSESITVEMKKKDAKYAAAFVIKSGIKSKWENAISEALEIQPMSNEERTNVFKPQVESSKLSKLNEVEEKEKLNKRKRLNEPDFALKRSKHENGSETKSRNHRSTENNKNNSRLNSETPPTSPHVNSEKISVQTVEFRGEDDIGVFEVYYERNRDMLEDEYPDASEADIRKYLKRTWDNMNSSFKKRYRAYVAQNKNTPKENSSDHEDDLASETETNVKEKRSKSKVEKDELPPIPETKRSRSYNLFKGMKQEKVCQICEKTGKLTRCKGPCYSYFHLSCVKPGESSPEHSIDESMDDTVFNNTKENKKSSSDKNENNGKAEEQEDEMFKCIDCLSGVAPACFICNEREGERIRCSVLACGRHYHAKCLKFWPQSHWQGGRLTCPYHVCHMCSSDNPQDSHCSRGPNERLARCVRCPSSYHTSTSCLPAGSTILTGSQIICPKHYKTSQPPLNAAWCFLCTRGGSLICCDTCPTSFHLECLGIKAPDGTFICEDCETGRLPLYGEVVWVKLGQYRWWPARICFPYEIPEKIEAIPHSPGKFCVMFLGSRDYYWVHRGRAFLYQDGDANIKPPIGKKNVREDLYRKALEEANEIHQNLKIERAAAKDNGRGLKPPPYVKLKVNKPVGNVKPVEVESIVACECDAQWENPCGPGTDCLNRILLVECSPGICPAGVKCKNQSFVLREYPNMEPFYTVERGWGLKTLERIESGQFVIEYVGEVIDEAEYRRRLQRKKELKSENFYFLTIDNNRTIDAEPKGNLSRFMNHSCMPNCETQKWTVNGDTRVGLFALRDIEVGEELTFNYNLACDGETRKPCLCGAPNCSGFIGLKAQKQPISATSQPKDIRRSEKTEKVKRRRRSRKHLSRCWSCGQGIPNSEEFVLCAQKTCGKKYHKNCISIDDSESRFSCPWHHCTECTRRTSAHCSFCSKAFCQVHLDGNLFEYGDKGAFVCKLHENQYVQKSTEEENSDNDTETDKEYSSTGSSSPLVMEKPIVREPSPRVSIVEVHPSSEESEESQKEEDEDTIQTLLSGRKSVMSVKEKTMLSLKLQRTERQTGRLNNLTSSQLEAIIGGSLLE